MPPVQGPHGPGGMLGNRHATRVVPTTRDDVEDPAVEEMPDEATAGNLPSLQPPLATSVRADVSACTTPCRRAQSHPRVQGEVLGTAVWPCMHMPPPRMMPLPRNTALSPPPSSPILYPRAHPCTAPPTGGSLSPFLPPTLTPPPNCSPHRLFPCAKIPTSTPVHAQHRRPATPQAPPQALKQRPGVSRWARLWAPRTSPMKSGPRGRSWRSGVPA